MELFYEVQLDSGAKYRVRGEDTLNIRVGDYCVIRKDFFLDYGQIVKRYDQTPGAPEKELTAPEQDVAIDENGREIVVREKTSELAQKKNLEVPRIQRKATVVDQGKANENSVRAKSVLRTTQQFIERLNLPMKLINAHYAFDGKMITIQFAAEGRVDFRELVKQLSHTMNTRIELHQIGVRDETAIIGGISVCGRPLCCCAFLREFASINVKMAKEQDLALTPGSISGICGRLKCCLKYEHEGYLELERTMPRRGDICDTNEGRGRIVERNLLTQKVVVQLDGSDRSITCPKEEVSVVYPEKYKINQPPKRNAPPAPAEPAKKNRKK